MLNIQYDMKPETMLLNVIPDQVNELRKEIFLYVITAARMVFARYWKSDFIPNIFEWKTKLAEFAVMAELTNLVKMKSIDDFTMKWQPFYDYYDRAI